MSEKKPEQVTGLYLNRPFNRVEMADTAIGVGCQWLSAKLIKNFAAQVERLYMIEELVY